MKIIDSIKGVFSKKDQRNGLTPVEHKLTTDYAPLLYPGIFDRIILKQDYQLAAAVGMTYYRQCPIAYTAINLIAEEIASIVPMVWNKKTEEWIDDHPVLDLLRYPNADIVWEEYFSDFARYFLITGNAYNMATGDVRKPPLELRMLMPQMMAIIASSADGFAQSMRFAAFWGSYQFERDEVDGRFRYYTADKNRECYQTKFFNPTSTAQMVYGMSPLAPVFYEIEQFLSLNRHNLSILERGARPTGFFYIDSQDDTVGLGLSQEQKDRLRTEISQLYSGSSNAGRTGFFSDKIGFQEMMKTNRDMDFETLRTSVTNTIYNSLKIPLPLISPDHMTLANYEVAKLSLYDNVIIPLAKRMFSELSNFLMPRYSDNEDLIITFSQRDITALEPRKNEQMNILKNLNIFTINELRNEYGAEPLSDGADQLYIPSTSMPIAQDLDTTQTDYDIPGVRDAADIDATDEDENQEGENDENIDDGDNDKTEREKASRTSFELILRNRLDQNGARIFSDQEISDLADKHGI